MIELTRLNGKAFIANCEMIQFVESTPDTVITFYNGTKLMVKESLEEVVDKSREYRASISGSPPSRPPVESREEKEKREKWI